MQLETTRLLVREGRKEDIAGSMQFRNSEFVLQYNCMDMVNEEYCTKEILNPYTWVIELKENHEVIGVIDVHEDSVRYRIASKELSYYLNEVYAKKGYMKEALEVLISYLFTELQLECISARAFTANEASHHLLLSLGFHQDGVIPRCVKAYRDVIYDDGIYSLLKEEWRK